MSLTRITQSPVRPSVADWNQPAGLPEMGSIAKIQLLPALIVPSSSRAMDGKPLRCISTPMHQGSDTTMPNEVRSTSLNAVVDEMNSMSWTSAARFEGSVPAPPRVQTLRLAKIVAPSRSPPKISCAAVSRIG